MKIPRPQFWTLFALLLLQSEAPVFGQEKSLESVTRVNELVHVQTGDLPIILSAPHGGTAGVPGVSERKGVGLPTGPSGFFTGRDGGTEELALEVSDAIKKRFGKAPYLVVSKVHRKYMDPNRPADIAFEDAAMKPYYDHYHDTLSKYCREVSERFQAGVLLDLHGQGTNRETVFRGTKNGLTVRHLREMFGEEAHHGSKSLFGLLSARGWTVHPSPQDNREQSGFTGGFIVQTHGGNPSKLIDAIQLEFGAEYRVVGKRAKTAEVLADALTEYASLYLKTQSLRGPQTSELSKPGLKVAVFVDEGVSSTKSLLKALATDDRVVASKISASEIREGKLSQYSVLIHPGGSAKAQSKALGEVGRQKVREFVQSGHGMVGICAGAYLACSDSSERLKILDAKVVDREHWNRGFGTVVLEITPFGQEVLALNDAKKEIYYHQGPLLAPADDPQVPDFRTLAKFDSEISKNGAPTGVMIGTTAIALGEFGQGRVICFSPHPEKTPDLESILLQGIHWAGRD